MASTPRRQHRRYVPNSSPRMPGTTPTGTIPRTDSPQPHQHLPTYGERNPPLTNGLTWDHVTQIADALTQAGLHQQPISPPYRPDPAADLKAYIADRYAYLARPQAEDGSRPLPPTGYNPPTQSPLTSIYQGPGTRVRRYY